MAKKEQEYKSAKKLTADNTVIAFISDNDEGISRLFDKLKRRTDKIAKEKADGTVSCIEVSQKVPLCENLAEIICGWAVQGWDASVKRKSLYDKDTKEAIKLGVVSYIPRMMILRKGDKCITYVHIKPGTIQDMSPCIGAFSVLYLDLCSAHSPVFKLGKEKDRQKGFRCFPFISAPLPSLDPEGWLQLFRNYLEFAEVTGGACCSLEYEDRKEEDDIRFDSASATIAARQSPVKLPDIIEVTAIDPLPFLNEGNADS